MIKSTDALKVSLIIQGLKANKLDIDVVINRNPRNKSDSINKNGNPMKFDSESNEYYIELKEGISASVTQDSASVRLITKDISKSKDYIEGITIILDKLKDIAVVSASLSEEQRDEINLEITEVISRISRT